MPDILDDGIALSIVCLDAHAYIAYTNCKLHQAINHSRGIQEPVGFPPVVRAGRDNMLGAAGVIGPDVREVVSRIITGIRQSSVIILSEQRLVLDISGCLSGSPHGSLLLCKGDRLVGCAVFGKLVQ